MGVILFIMTLKIVFLVGRKCCRMSLAGQRGCLGCPQFSMDSFGRAIPRRENTFLSLMSDDMMIQMYPTEIAVVVEREKK